MHKVITSDYFPGKDCHCEARSSYECGCDADWTPTETYKLREDAKQLADRLTALELHSTSELARLEQERNEARIDAKKSKAYKRVLKVANANLKRERDKAREDLEDIKEYGTEEINDAVDLRQRLASALIERDEALSQIVQAECRAERFCQERDEARAELMKIEDLFIDGTDIYADRENMGLIAREALEGTK